MMKNDADIIVEYTSSFVRRSDYRDLAEKALAVCAEYGFKFGIQVHNTADFPELEKAAALNVPMTFHAPVLCDYQINLAASDFAPAMNSLKITAEYMRKYNVAKAVFHGFNMTDVPIPSFGRGLDYVKAFGPAMRRELCLDGTFLCNDFIGTPEYKMRFERVVERLAWMKKEYPDLEFLIENDFPSFGAGSLFADFAAGLDNPVCLDVSHLWAAAFILDRDYFTEAEAFLKNGNVRMLHLHASPYTSSVPKHKWSDGHMSLLTPNKMDLPRLVSLCGKYNVKHYVLEIIETLSERDINAFACMFNGK